jgi:hypothetical protein
VSEAEALEKKVKRSKGDKDRREAENKRMAELPTAQLTQKREQCNARKNKERDTTGRT